MFDQVKTAAGIHMSTFKDKADTPADVEAADSDRPEDLDISDWTPMPSQMAQWRG